MQDEQERSRPSKGHKVEMPKEIYRVPAETVQEPKAPEPEAEEPQGTWQDVVDGIDQADHVGELLPSSFLQKDIDIEDGFGDTEAQLISEIPTPRGKATSPLPANAVALHNRLGDLIQEEHALSRRLAEETEESKDLQERMNSAKADKAGLEREIDRLKAAEKAAMNILDNAEMVSAKMQISTEPGGKVVTTAQTAPESPAAAPPMRHAETAPEVTEAHAPEAAVAATETKPDQPVKTYYEPEIATDTNADQPVKTDNKPEVAVAATDTKALDTEDAHLKEVAGEATSRAKDLDKEVAHLKEAAGEATGAQRTTPETADNPKAEGLMQLQELHKVLGRQRSVKDKDTPGGTADFLEDPDLEKVGLSAKAGEVQMVTADLASEATDTAVQNKVDELTIEDLKKQIEEKEAKSEQLKNRIEKLQTARTKADATIDQAEAGSAKASMTDQPSKEDKSSEGGKSSPPPCGAGTKNDCAEASSHAEEAPSHAGEAPPHKEAHEGPLEEADHERHAEAEHAPNPPKTLLLEDKKPEKGRQAQVEHGSLLEELAKKPAYDATKERSKQMDHQIDELREQKLALDAEIAELKRTLSDLEKRHERNVNQLKATEAGLDVLDNGQNQARHELEEAVVAIHEDAADATPAAPAPVESLHFRPGNPEPQ
eukprot:gnl/TRDRNA2_/TRDRNA2_175374_c2_seq1.p1 gnl/TRDRNA2_/TRDRNA2_175374_c2~~gnl/TRDRNA2_/TRDRNA2_175374_c2_seq1.p1  ORF type:complete len:728 (-),score=229.88 gnl/TRDRNA2_/TRDRNA2_175374_c2_seq1:251-2221(-)